MCVYALEVDGTTPYGYHTPTDEGLMHYGHSQDHRPDLPQLKLMAAAAEPSGHFLACAILARPPMTPCTCRSLMPLPLTGETAEQIAS